MKNFLLLVMTVGIAFLFSGCGNKNYYNDDKAIVAYGSRGYMQGAIQNIDADNSIVGRIDKLDGISELAQADVDSDKTTTLHFSVTASSGKIKFVLVKPDSKVEVLEEVVADKGSYDGDVSVDCPKGVSKLKIVGDNYNGSYRISQTKDALFTSSISSTRN